MKRLSLSFLCLSFVACSTVPEEEIEIIDKSTLPTVLPQKLPEKKIERKIEKVVQKKKSEVQQVRSESVYGSIPIEDNVYVQNWVSYFTGRGKKHMKKYLERAHRYGPMIQKILKEHGLPQELIYLAMIESGFSWRAKSSMSAVGFWQFIRGTAKSYGLRVDKHIDQRRDLELSTHAAAKYLKSLYNLFGSWYLAIAAYNVGENKMKRTLMKRHTRDFWTLIEKKALPKETLNYVPKFTAARMIGMNPEKYGFDNLKPLPVFEYQEMAVFRPLNLASLAKHMGVKLDVLRELNPDLRTHHVPVPAGKGRRLRVPPGTLSSAYKSVAKAYIRPRLSRSRKTVFYKVKSGDNLFHIAKKFDTTVGQLQKLNKLQRGRVLHVGKVLKVPASRLSLRALNLLRKSQPSNKKYKVRPGDTLLGIAKRHRVSLSGLRRANKMRPRSVLMAGSWLKIP